MAVGNWNDIAIALTRAHLRQAHVYRKASITAVANNFYSLWGAAGFPGAGANGTPPASVAPTNASAGAIPIVAAGDSMKDLRLLPIVASGVTAGGLIMYDRLLAAAINLTIDTLQTFTGVVTPTRYTDGVGTLMALEMTTATVLTASTLTINYLNTLGAAKSATLALAAGEVVDRVYFIDLAAGDVGVKTLVSAQLSAAKTGGQANIVLFNKELFMPVPYAANLLTPSPVMDMPEVDDAACLCGMMMATNTSTGLIVARIPLIEA